MLDQLRENQFLARYKPDGSDLIIGLYVLAGNWPSTGQLQARGGFNILVESPQILHFDVNGRIRTGCRIVVVALPSPLVPLSGGHLCVSIPRGVLGTSILPVWIRDLCAPQFEPSRLQIAVDASVERVEEVVFDLAVVLEGYKEVRTAEFTPKGLCALVLDGAGEV